jgi:uncharacterized glyoxalase superfamily protein PhnB
MKSVMPSLVVADMRDSIRFYEDALGFKATDTMPGPDGELIHASIRNGDVELMMGPAGFAGEPITGDVGKGVALYLAVGDGEDIDALFERAKRAGARVLQEPHDEFWGDRIWSVADPDGYELVVAKHVRDVSDEEMTQLMQNWVPAG